MILCTLSFIQYSHTYLVNDAIPILKVWMFYGAPFQMILLGKRRASKHGIVKEKADTSKFLSGGF